MKLLKLDETICYRLSKRNIFATEKLFIHGANTKNLQSILKKGVLYNAPSKIWSSEDKDLESFTGSYWTTAMAQAWDAANSARLKLKTGERLFVFAIIETRSHDTVIDEDYLSSRLGLVAMEMSYEFKAGRLTAPEAIDKIIAYLTDAFKETIPAKRWEKKRPIIQKFVEHVQERSVNYKMPLDKQLLQETIDRLPDLTTIDTPFIGNKGDRKSVTNIRVKDRDVGYRGAYKIIAVVEAKKIKDEYVKHPTLRSLDIKQETYQIISHYGQAPNILKQYIEQQGNKIA